MAITLLLTYRKLRDCLNSKEDCEYLISYALCPVQFIIIFNVVRLHTHDLNDATEFAGQNVLVIGSNLCVDDIGRMLCKHVKSVTICRLLPVPIKMSVESLPDLWREVGRIVKFVGNTALFEDEAEYLHFDAIIFCTGYSHSFPFLTPDLCFEVANKYWLDGLYKGVVFERNTRLFFIGRHSNHLHFV